MQDKPGQRERTAGQADVPDRGKPVLCSEPFAQNPIFRSVRLPRGFPAEDRGAGYVADGIFPPSVCAALFNELARSLHWEERSIQLFGRRMQQPRLVAFYGDSGASYRYSGTLYQPRSWTRELLLIRARVEELVGASFNAVLCNLYRSGNDSMGWHSDDEPELGRHPVIASVSLGATRSLRIRLRKSQRRRTSIGIALTDGSLFLMTGALQEHYQHQIPKVTAAAGAGPRINLTFRHIDRAQGSGRARESLPDR